MSQPIPCLALTFLLTLPASASSPQTQHECAMDLSPQEAAAAWRQKLRGAYELPETALAREGLGTPDSYVVPLTFHVVRRSDGTGGLPPARTAQAVIDANNAFAGSGIEFCLAGPIDYIDSDEFYSEINTLNEIDVLRSTNVVPGTVNVYFTETLDYEQGSLCGISAFTFSPVQGIAMNNACTALPENPSTFPHELGHYFDLLHTHEPFYGFECADGSNCADAGDLVCDTPADPRLGYDTVNELCEYTGVATDFCNTDSFTPMVDNYMSYSRKECRDIFTQGQRDRALATLLNLRSELALPFCAGGISKSCTFPVPNSVGATAQLSVTGSGLAAENSLLLRTRGLPQNVLGIYLNSQTVRDPFRPSGSAGNICLGGQVGRYSAPSQVGFSGPSAEIELQLDLSATPTPLGFVMVTAGQDWAFQLWYRDAAPDGTATSNFSDAITITFI